jgi:hypothetical protein
MARPKRFELLTPRFVVWCSIQLSYGRVSDFSRLPHSADERAAFRLSNPEVHTTAGGRFFLFGRDDIGGAKAQGKRRSPLGRRPAFCAQPASERSARLPCPVGRGRHSCPANLSRCGCGVPAPPGCSSCPPPPYLYHQGREGGLVSPAEPGPRLARVAEEGIDLGRAEITRITSASTRSVDFPKRPLAHHTIVLPT